MDNRTLIEELQELGFDAPVPDGEGWVMEKGRDFMVGYYPEDPDADYAFHRNRGQMETFDQPLTLVEHIESTPEVYIRPGDDGILIESPQGDTLSLEEFLRTNIGPRMGNPLPIVEAAEKFREASPDEATHLPLGGGSQEWVRVGCKKCGLRTADARSKVAPGIYVAQIDNVVDLAAESLYPDLDYKTTIPVDIVDLEGAFSRFAEETKERVLEFIMDPDNAKEVDYNAVGMVNPLPTMEVEDGYTETEEIVEPNLLEEIDKDEPAPEPETRTVREPQTKEVIHPDVEHGFLDWIEDSNFLMDAYHLTGEFGIPTLAEGDAGELFYDPGVLSRLGVDSLARDVDDTLYRVIDEGARDAKERLAERTLQDAGEAVGLIWDRGAGALARKNPQERDLRELLERVQKVEKLWYEAQDEASIRRLKNYIEEKVWGFLVDEIGDQYWDTEYEEALGMISEGADYATYELEDAIEELQAI